MKKDSAEWLVLDYLCKIFREHADQKRIERLKVLHVAKKATRVAPGDASLAIDDLARKEYIFVSGKDYNYYRATDKGYRFWKKEIEFEELTDLGIPNNIKIDHHEKAAKEAEEIAEDLRGDNKSNNEQVQITIQNCKAFSISLLENEGSVSRESANKLAESLKKIDETTGIAERVVRRVLMFFSALSFWLS